MLNNIESFDSFLRNVVADHMSASEYRRSDYSRFFGGARGRALKVRGFAFRHSVEDD